MREPRDRSEELAAHLLAGLEALRTERWAAAIEALRIVAEDAELAAAEDLRDVRSRACTLLAQALLGAGDLDGCTPWLDEAERLIGTHGDAAGLAEIRELRRQHKDLRTERARKAQTRARLLELAAVPMEALRARAASPAMLQELLVQKANAEIEAGRPEAAAAVATEAIALAVALDSVRGEVFARMSLARAAPDVAQAELTVAWRRAERANEFNLVGAVARAAASAGVALPKLHGPQLGPPR